jgi:hypothetical protein
MWVDNQREREKQREKEIKRGDLKQNDSLCHP